MLKFQLLLLLLILKTAFACCSSAEDQVSDVDDRLTDDEIAVLLGINRNNQLDEPPAPVCINQEPSELALVITDSLLMAPSFIISIMALFKFYFVRGSPYIELELGIFSTALVLDMIRLPLCLKPVMSSWISFLANLICKIWGFLVSLLVLLEKLPSMDNGVLWVIGAASFISFVISVGRILKYLCRQEEPDLLTINNY